MRSLIVFALMIALLSCNNEEQIKEPYKTMLQTCDSVAIVFYNGGDTLNFGTRDSTGIHILSATLRGEKETIPANCTPVGELRYQAQNQTLYTAQFALSDSGNARCDYVLYQQQQDQFVNKLSARAANLLKEVYQFSKTDSAQQKPTITPDTSALISDTVAGQ